MKTVVTNAQVCHLWAHQSQEHARSGNGNVSFSGRDLYSYQTVIATIVDAADGSKVALVSSRGFSPTTGKQKNNIYRALGYSGEVMPSFTVPELGKPGGMVYFTPMDRDPVALHRFNAESFRESFLDCLARFKRAREVNTWILGQAREQAEQYASYVKLFAVDLPAIDVDTLIKAAEDERIAINRARNTPEAIAKREKEATARLAREIRDFRSVSGKFNLDWTESWHGDSRFSATDREVRSEAIARLNADKIAAWLSGHTNIVPRHGDSALLRIKGQAIQTSWGAEFPVDHGKRAFAVIAHCRRTGSEWHTNGKTIHLGPFAVNTISAEGDVKAGCHLVRWPAIERVAKELGLVQSGECGISS